MKHPSRELVITIQGKLWNVYIEALKGLTVHKRCIYVNPNHYGKDFCGTLVHEVIHANFPYMSERRVVEIENSITDLLWAVGYRNINEISSCKIKKRAKKK
jgi:hypothetical protein